MTPDRWLEKFYTGEVFSGQFEHLKEFIKKHQLDQGLGTVITIAGTNGKGETSRLINHFIVSQNKSCALWTSPHLETVTERFVFNGEQIEANKLLSVFQQVEQLLEADQQRMSYFEFLFVSFLVLLRKYKSEYVVLEVGLGGRLDAVNCLDADIVALTSISRDHQEILGNRYELILREKLGVLRAGREFFSALELKYLRQKAFQFIADKNIHWIDLFSDKVLSKSSDFSLRNQKLAMAVVARVLSCSVNQLQQKTDFSLRRKILAHGVEYQLFPSHNIDGFRKLVQFLQGTTYNQINEIIISFSDRSIRDLEVMLQIVRKRFPATNITLYHFSHFKAVPLEKLMILHDKYKLNITDDRKFAAEFNPDKNQKILVTGSNYFLGHFIQQL